MRISDWSSDVCSSDLANNLPTATSFRCQDLFDNEHRNYVGELGTSVSPKLAGHVKAADLLLVVGARLGEMTTDRKRVVWGKSGGVSVATGGCRFINKKK